MEFDNCIKEIKKIYPKAEVVYGNIKDKSKFKRIVFKDGFIHYWVKKDRYTLYKSNMRIQSFKSSEFDELLRILIDLKTLKPYNY